MKLSEFESLLSQIKSNLSDNQDPELYIESAPNQKHNISGIYFEESSIKIH